MTALLYLIDTFFTIFFFFVLLRFLLQLVRADFFNPFSQAAVKITNPFLKPLRSVIPGLWGIDFASVVLLLIVQILHAYIIKFIIGGDLGFLSVLILSVLGTIMTTTWLIIACCVILAISSFVAPYSSHPILLLTRQFLQPFLGPLQRLIPPMGGLDIAFLILFILIRALQMLLQEVVAPYQYMFAYIIGL